MRPLSTPVQRMGTGTLHPLILQSTLSSSPFTPSLLPPPSPAARSQVFIAGLWVSPDLHLLRPPRKHPNSRLDRLLEHKARQGVQVSQPHSHRGLCTHGVISQISQSWMAVVDRQSLSPGCYVSDIGGGQVYVLVFKEGPGGMTTNSKYTKARLNALDHQGRLHVSQSASQSVMTRLCCRKVSSVSAHRHIRPLIRSHTTGAGLVRGWRRPRLDAMRSLTKAWPLPHV